jgi:hemerythrin-like metal-binding protein
MEIQMELFTWDNKYSVSNAELDNHHKKLFSIFNKLYKTCLDKNSELSVDPIIEELVSYTVTHFVAEEKYMKSIGYKDINKHISEHWYFKERICKQQHVKDINNTVVSKEIVLYLWNWLINHVMTEDRKYAIYLNRRQQHGNTI